MLRLQNFVEKNIDLNDLSNKIMFIEVNNIHEYDLEYKTLDSFYYSRSIEDLCKGLLADLLGVNCSYSVEEMLQIINGLLELVSDYLRESLGKSNISIELDQDNVRLEIRYHLN